MSQIAATSGAYAVTQISTFNDEAYAAYILLVVVILTLEFAYFEYVYPRFLKWNRKREWTRQKQKWEKLDRQAREDYEKNHQKKQPKKPFQIRRPRFTIPDLPTTGQILKELGIKREKPNKPVISAGYMEGDIAPLHRPAIKPINISKWKKQIEERGEIKLDDNSYLGKKRGYDALIFLRDELRRQYGIKARLGKNKLFK